MSIRQAEARQQAAAKPGPRDVKPAKLNAAAAPKQKPKIPAVMTAEQRAALTSPFWRRHDPELRAMAEQGFTTQQAAAALGVTKSTVIGRGYRIGIVWARSTGPRDKPAAVATDFPPPGQCLWPIGDPKSTGFHFCGAEAAAAGGVYCKRHREVGRIKPSRAAQATSETAEAA